MNNTHDGIRPGLVSVSLRELSPETIIQLCPKAGIQGIEWGGDLHVPHGAIKTASHVANLMRDAGLCTVSYGSYYRCGAEDDDRLDFDDVLETAIALNAPAIRVWLGTAGSKQTPPEQRQRALDDLSRIAKKATAENILICAEKHADTLTDADDSVADILNRVTDQNFRMLWQPTNGACLTENLITLDLCLPSLAYLHVFHWWPDHHHRLPLADGEKRWMKYLKRSAHAAQWAMLEFFQHDSVDQFLADAQTLRQWLNLIAAPSVQPAFKWKTSIGIHERNHATA
ncbi:sugar phosphate isomerase/epimerase [Candidatus Sumerlaeota bacterium]|nr:sugar phosphate isomerase/epimerase [Candidatus Sumerlaeota bacterium]